MNGKQDKSFTSQSDKSTGKKSVHLNIYGENDIHLIYCEKDDVKIEIGKHASEIYMELRKHVSDVTSCPKSAKEVAKEMSRIRTDARPDVSSDDKIQALHISETLYTVAEENILLREEARDEQLDVGGNHQCIPYSMQTEVKGRHDDNHIRHKVDSEPPVDWFQLGCPQLWAQNTLAGSISGIKQNNVNEYSNCCDASQNALASFLSFLRRFYNLYMERVFHSAKREDKTEYGDSASDDLDVLTDAGTFQFPTVDYEALDGSYELEQNVHNPEKIETWLLRGVHSLRAGEYLVETDGSERQYDIQLNAMDTQLSGEDPQVKVNDPKYSSALSCKSTDHEVTTSKTGIERLESAKFLAMESKSTLINQTGQIKSKRDPEKFDNSAVSKPSPSSSKSAITMKDRTVLKSLDEPDKTNDSTVPVHLIMEDQTTIKDRTVLIKAGESNATVSVHSTSNSRYTKDHGVTLCKTMTKSEHVDASKVDHQVSAKVEGFFNFQHDETAEINKQDQSQLTSVIERTSSLSLSTPTAEPRKRGINVKETINNGATPGLLKTGVNANLLCLIKSYRDVPSCWICRRSSQFHPRKKTRIPRNDRRVVDKCWRRCYHLKDKQIEDIRTRRWYTYYSRLASKGRRWDPKVAAKHRLTCSMRTNYMQSSGSYTISQQACLSQEKSRCAYSLRKQIEASDGEWALRKVTALPVSSSLNLVLPTSVAAQHSYTEDVEQANKTATPRRTHPYSCDGTVIIIKDHKSRMEKEFNATSVDTDEGICLSGDNDLLTLDPGGRWGGHSSDKQGDANNNVYANSETERGKDGELSVTPTAVLCHPLRRHPIQIVKDRKNPSNNTAVTESKGMGMPSAAVEAQLSVGLHGTQSQDSPSNTSLPTASQQMSVVDYATTKANIATEDLKIAADCNRGQKNQKQTTQNDHSPDSATKTEDRRTTTNANVKSCSCCVGELLKHAGCSMETIKFKEQLIYEMERGRSPLHLKTIYGLALWCLRNIMKQWEIDKLMGYTYSPYAAHETHVHNVLNELKAQGLKIGHVVQYFSREDSERSDILELIAKIHPDCRYCSARMTTHKRHKMCTSFSSYRGNGIKETIYRSLISTFARIRGFFCTTKSEDYRTYR